MARAPSEDKNLKPKKYHLFSVITSITILILIVTLLSPISTPFLPKSLSTSKTQAQSLPAYNYTRTFDTANGQAWSNSVTTDSSGNIYITGGFRGTVIFDGPGGSHSVTTANQSVFLTKYNPDGSYAWTKTFDTSAGSSTFSIGVTTDRSSNVYVTGQFKGTVIFDGPGGSHSSTSLNADIFITKYNADGSYAWTKTFDTSAAGSDAQGISVATDNNGNIYATGFFDNTVIFDGPGGSHSVTTANTNTFLTKYNANGTYAWTKTFDTSAASAFAEGNGVTTDSSGNIYIAGFFLNTVIFDGQGGSQSITSANNSTFLTKYDASGTYVYTKTFDTSASGALAISQGLTTDSSGNVYETGWFNGTVIFDGPGGSHAITAAHNSAFLTKYTPSGIYVFTKTSDSNSAGSSSFGNGLTTDSSGNIYEVGWFNGTVIFDGPGGSDSASTSAFGVQYLTKYSPDGTYAWTERQSINGSSNGACDNSNICGSVAISATTGQAFITDDFGGTVTFDGPGGSDTRTSANDNVFLTSYQVFIPSSGLKPSAAPAATLATPRAPNTGFGVLTNNPAIPLLITSASASAILLLAYILRRNNPGPTVE